MLLVFGRSEPGSLRSSPNRAAAVAGVTAGGHPVDPDVDGRGVNASPVPVTTPEGELLEVVRRDDLEATLASGQP